MLADFALAKHLQQVAEAILAQQVALQSPADLLAAAALVQQAEKQQQRGAKQEQGADHQWRRHRLRNIRQSNRLPITCMPNAVASIRCPEGSCHMATR